MHHQIAQVLFNHALKVPPHFRGRAHRIALTYSAGITSLVRHILRDPVVAYRLRGTKLALPVSHALPRILLRHPNYATNLGRIAASVFMKYADSCMIDIGANVGDTVAVVRSNCQMPILCIEGDTFFFDLLEANTKQFVDIELDARLVSDRRTSIFGTLDSQHGTSHVSREGTAQLDAWTLTDILRDHPRFGSAKLLKIDTDGFDTLILKGATNFIEANRPIIFFEYDPHFFMPNDSQGIDIMSLLYGHGYTSALYFKNTGELRAYVALDDDAEINALHEECAGRGGKYYFDVCVCHAEDTDLLRAIYIDESQGYATW